MVSYVIRGWKSPIGSSWSIAMKKPQEKNEVFPSAHPGIGATKIGQHLAYAKIGPAKCVRMGGGSAMGHRPTFDAQNAFVLGRGAC